MLYPVANCVAPFSCLILVLSLTCGLNSNKYQPEDIYPYVVTVCLCGNVRKDRELEGHGINIIE